MIFVAFVDCDSYYIQLVNVLCLCLYVMSVIICNVNLCSCWLVIVYLSFPSILIPIVPVSLSKDNKTLAPRGTSLLNVVGRVLPRSRDQSPSLSLCPSPSPRDLFSDWP